MFAKNNVKKKILLIAAAAVIVTVQANAMPLAGNALAPNSVEKSLYNCLVSEVSDIATGATDSTKISVSLADIGVQQEWSAADVGQPIINEDGRIAETAIYAAIKKQVTATTISTAMAAVEMDYPQYTFWQMRGEKIWYSFDCIFFADANAEGTPIAKMFSGSLDINWTVNADYGSATTVAGNKLERVRMAQKEAQRVVDGVNGKCTYDKLVAFADYIRTNVSYDRAAVNGAYGDPWEFVNVFDNDPRTNVVCSGYAKAFKYLCDLAGIPCYYVTGTSGGAHAWNMVQMPDGNLYHVDMTFCDGTGTDAFFLKGATVEKSGAYTIQSNGKKVSYEYDNHVKNIFHDTLRPSQAPYQNPRALIETKIAGSQQKPWISLPAFA